MKRYKVLEFKRRRLGLTDYEKRLGLLKSRKTRIIIRKSNRYIQIQFVEYNPKGDKVLLTVRSKELKKLGWDYSCKNLPAAYLTGFYAGKTAIGKKINDGVFDIGRYSIVKGSILFAALKGIIDGGVKVPYSDEIVAEEKRLKGMHTKNKENTIKDFENLKEKLKGIK